MGADPADAAEAVTAGQEPQILSAGGAERDPLHGTQRGRLADAAGAFRVSIRRAPPSLSGEASVTCSYGRS
jgi:hypothetical protein